VFTKTGMDRQAHEKMGFTTPQKMVVGPWWGGWGGKFRKGVIGGETVLGKLT